VTTQYTPFELVYDTQPIMPIEFAIPIEKVCDLQQEDLDKDIRVRMEDLFRLDETFWQPEKILTIFNCCAKNKRMKKGR